MTNEELKGILNHCLNDAIVGRDRLRGTICSNDIAEFINEWLPKQLSLGTVSITLTERLLTPERHTLDNNGKCVKIEKPPFN
jgi:hypothetical protein